MAVVAFAEIVIIMVSLVIVQAFLAIDQANVYVPLERPVTVVL